MEKIIVLKNTTQSEIIVSSLGIIIEAGDSCYVNWDDILEISDSTELLDLINSNSIVVNDGSIDFIPLEAIEYLKVKTDLSNYYNKGETDSLIDERSPLVHNHDDLYYGKGDVDNLISGIEGYGIRGAVDAISNLPLSYSGNVGDIYIVRSTTGQGSMGPQPYTVNTDTALYLPMEDSLQDELGHELEVKDDAEIGSTLTPPLGTKYGEFDGDKAHIKVKKDDDLGQGPELTVGGWIYPKGTGSYAIIGRWGENGDGWKIDVRCNKLRGSLDTLSMNPVQFYDPDNLSPNQWIHVALVYNGSNVILYKNGMPVNQVSGNGIYIDSQDEYLYIGKWMKDYGDSDKDYFYGGMKEVFLQNKAMSQVEIQHLVFGDLENYYDEGFYQWDGSEWNFLAHNTGENGGGSGSSYHNSLLGLNTDDYQHLTQQEKLDLIGHNHDDRYYTENEVDSLLNNKSDDNHTHSQYQTSSQVDSKIQALKYSDISANDPNTNVTGSELETLTNGGNADGLHTHESLSGCGSGGLDEAYDNNSQYSPGVGRQINVDTGSVTLNASAGFAPLKLTPINYTPTQWLGGGELCFRDGDLFAYDATRGKWLSVSGYHIGGGVNSNNVKDSYLKGFNGTSFSSNVGWAAHWDGTVVSFSITSNDSGCSNAVQIRKNGSSIYELYYSQDKEQHRTNVNADFNAGDVLNFYMEGNDNGANRPQVWAIIKRRI